MSEIQLLQDQANLYYILAMFSLLFGFSIFVTVSIYALKIKLYPTIIVIIGMVVSLVLLNNYIGISEEIYALETEQTNQIRNNITLMSCDDQRSNIISQLKSNNQTMLSFQQDWYYANCETPLKPLVEKLK